MGAGCCRANAAVGAGRHWRAARSTTADVRSTPYSDGCRHGEPTSVYTVRGTTGVLLELAEEQRVSGFRTKRFLIGSLEAERLVAVLGKA